MKSYIEINNLQLQAFHGVLPQEQTVGNLYSIDLIIECDLSKAVESDDLADTINYAEAAEIVKEEMSIPSKLLEHVAGRITKHIKQQWPEQVKGIDLKIVKKRPPIPLDIEDCAVHIIE